MTKTKEETRIDLGDSLKDAIIKIGEGNPGALTVCMSLSSMTPTVDPDSGLGPWTYILFLDSLNIYGPRIWMLFKDVCAENIVTTIAILRATQLGFIARDNLKHAIDYHGDGIGVADAIRMVEERLPRFGKGMQEPTINNKNNIKEGG